jgi:hypothetical protein
MNFPSNAQGTKTEHTERSPPQNTMPYTNYFDNPYLSEPAPDYSLNTFFDSDSFFDQALASVEGVSDTTPKVQETFNPTFPATNIPPRNNDQPMMQTFNTHPSQLEQYPFGFAINTGQLQPNEPDSFSPTSTTSQPSSLGGDAPQPLISPSLSPHMLKRESPSSPTSASESSTPKRPTRKRGRPKMDRNSTDSSQVMTSPTTTKYQRSKRLPHNQVERKYREGLNSELERLRRSVPILRQSDEVGAIGQPKPSKAMILSSAIEYIQSIEKERDALIEENDRLRRGQYEASQQNSWDGMNL